MEDRTANVKIFFSDGRSPIVGRLLEKNSEYIRLDVGQFYMKNVSAVVEVLDNKK